MADKKKTPRSNNTDTNSAAKVTRIKASDSGRTPKTTTAVKSKKTITAKDQTPTKSKQHVSSGKIHTGNLGTYFKGAWHELKQVHWPNRRTTWGLTMAVIAFTAFFVVLIVVLDLLFQWLFDEIILG